MQKKDIVGLSNKALDGIHNKEHKWLAKFLATNASHYKVMNALRRTVTRVALIQRVILERAVKDGFARMFAAYWYTLEFADFGKKELEPISGFRTVLLDILARMDKKPDEHREFFTWMREKLDTIGLAAFYEQYGLIALRGYALCITSVLSLLLTIKLGDKDLLEDESENEEPSLLTKERVEWLLDHFDFLCEIKEHDLDPFEVVAERAAQEIPDLKVLIRRGRHMTRLLLDDLE